MASVHKVERSDRKSSPYWYASFRGADGRQYLKSTKKTKRSEALVVAQEFERMTRGVQTEAHYRRVASQIYERTAGKALTFHTCADWLEQWLQNTAATIKPSTLERYRSILKDFRIHLGDREKAPLASVTPDEITRYRDELQSRGLAPSTVNLSVRKMLSAPFEAARRLGYIPINPCAAVKALREEAPQSQTRRQAFNGDQIEALLATSRSGKWEDSGWEGAILCGMTTGLRLGDVVGLKWEQVDMKTGVVKVATAKTDNDLSIPLHSSFVSWLKNQTRGIGKAPVFPSLHGRSIGGANGLSRAFKKLMDSAGVKGDVTRKGADQDTRAELKTRAGRTLSSLSFHSLRHTATSLMANAGVAADTRKAITGHADDRVHDKYTHHKLDTLRAAVNKIPVPAINSRKRKQR